MTEYQLQKNICRVKAMIFQERASSENLSYSELAEYQGYFEKVGKRYGLLKEFKANGIC